MGVLDAEYVRPAGQPAPRKSSVAPPPSYTSPVNYRPTTNFPYASSGGMGPPQSLTSGGGGGGSLTTPSGGQGRGRPANAPRTPSMANVLSGGLPQARPPQAQPYNPAMPNGMTQPFDLVGALRGLLGGSDLRPQSPYLPRQPIPYNPQQLGYHPSARDAGAMGYGFDPARISGQRGPTVSAGGYGTPPAMLEQMRGGWRF